MARSLVVVSGPARSGKTHYLLSRYRKELRACKPGTALWLAPSWRPAADVRNRILDSELPACWEPGILTFDKFAQAILEFPPSQKGTVPFSSHENWDSPARLLTSSMKRQLVRSLIEEQLARGRLRHFSAIATTGGLLDLVCEMLSELKRLEIWPDEFRRACQARAALAEQVPGMAAKDQELLELYETYQLTLRENQLYDAEGRFWSARDRLQQGQRRPFERLRLVVADGFTDFTRTEHEILELLAGWVDEILISLPLESEPRRADLFSKPLKTLRELERRHGNLSIKEIPRPENPSWPAMSCLEKNLFLNPRRACATGIGSATRRTDAKGIEILPAAKPQAEMELVGAKIKLLIAEQNARPGDIAVVFRSAQDAAGLAAEVFNRLGIPASWEIGQTLDRIAVMRALTSLLQLDREDWPFRRLLAVLGNNYFQPDWPEWQGGKSAAILEKTVRSLQIPHGRRDLLDQLAAGTDQSASSILNRLAGAFDELPASATLPQWAKAWERLALQTGLLRDIGQNNMFREPGFRVQGSGYGILPTGSVEDVLYCAQDSIAWHRLQAALMAGDTLATWRNRRAEELDREHAFEALCDILRSERLPAADDESGRVRVLGATSVRSLEVPYLFLAGLSEKTFPPPDREDRLYSEAEYLELIEKGLPLAARTDRARDEMLLFYEVVTRAARRLYLSYAALDSAAQPLSPSPYVLEVIQACGAEIVHSPVLDIRPIPSGDEPLSAAQFRVKAMADALGLSNSPLPLGEGQGEGEVPKNSALPLGEVPREGGTPKNSPLPLGEGQGEGDDAGNLSLFAALLRSKPANILPGLETIVLRQRRGDFGPAEGMLIGKAAKNIFAAEFSPEHCFTASELEQYAACPFRFLLGSVLKLEPPEDITLELDALERGQIVHGVLALFHRRVNESLHRPASPLELAADEFQRLLEKALEDSLPGPAANPLRNALVEINRRLIVKWLAEYRKQCETYDALWSAYDRPLVPEFFETSFGESKHRDPSGIAIDEPMEFAAGKETVRVSGRIDRIDTGIAAGKNVFNILDYKTGKALKFDPSGVKRGTSLQLPVYAMAAMKLLLNERDARPLQAGYWNVAKDGFKPRHSLVMHKLGGRGVEITEEWEQTRLDLESIIPILVQCIRGAQFRVFNPDQDCTRYCPFGTVCRIGQIRSLEKTWTPVP